MRVAPNSQTPLTPIDRDGALRQMQLDRREARALRREAARRRKQRAWILLSICVGVVALGAIGAFAWTKATAFGFGRSATSTEQLSQARVADQTPATPAQEASVAVTAPPKPVVDAAPTPPTDTGDAVAKAAVRFPDAPSVKPASIGQLKPRHKYVAFTIDDGYGFQPEMLALLQKYDARCTTFVLGSWVASNPAAVKKLDAAGFEIANHTWDHKLLTRLDSEQQRTELLRTQKAISAITGNQAPYMRPPGGATNSRVKGVSADLGYTQVMWNRSFGDSGRGATPEKLYQNVMTSNGGVRPGDIILCHWSSKSSYEAMKRILPELKAQGYQFVTISELIADSKGNAKPSKK